MALPILSDNFFNSHPPSVELFHKWQNLTHWNEGLIPIYEWNGILFIGKDEPQGTSSPEFSESDYLKETMNSLQVPHVILQAKAEYLKSIWNSWQERGQQEPSNLENQDSPIEANDGPNEMPDGLDLNPNLNHSAPLFSFESIIEKPIFNDEKTPPPIPMAEKKSASPPPPPAKINVAQSATPPPPPILKRSVAATAPPPPPALKSTATAAAPPPPPIAIKEEVRKQMPPPVPIKASPIVKKQDLDEMSVESTFDKLNAHFERSMIFSVQNDEVLPWKWSAGFQLQPGMESKSLNMNEPSPFRVVKMTLKSFHGPIPENSVTQNFSKTWIKGNELRSCTAAPIFDLNELVAILLTTNDQDSVTKKELELTEAAAVEITKEFNSKKTNFKAS